MMGADRGDRPQGQCVKSVGRESAVRKLLRSSMLWLRRTQQIRLVAPLMVVVVRLLFVVLIGLIGTAGCNREPIPGPSATETPTISGDSALDMGTTAAKEPASEAALPGAVASDKGLRPTSSSARVGTANRIGIPVDAGGREPIGQRQSRLFPLQRPDDEGDQKRVLLLFLLGVQQSRRAEAP